MNTENRRVPKASIKWPVTIEGSQGEMEGVMTVVTPNGAFIRCSKPLRLNEVINVTITAPNRAPFQIRAEVVLSNMYGPDDKISPHGMGVRFLNITSKDRWFIVAILEDQGLEKVANDYLKTLNITVERLSRMRVER